MRTGGNALTLKSMTKEEYYGGLSKYRGNKAGAKYGGTGYCDAQCPHDLKFINGEANSATGKSPPTTRTPVLAHVLPGMTVDTTKKLTVVTRFLKGTDG
ncbi:Concanavalin A-like lectin/glucanase domain containing protein [Naviculisporaceae sp. PSN 640]